MTVSAKRKPGNVGGNDLVKEMGEERLPASTMLYSARLNGSLESTLEAEHEVFWQSAASARNDKDGRCAKHLPTAGDVLREPSASNRDCFTKFFEVRNKLRVFLLVRVMAIFFSRANDTLDEG